MLLVGYCHGIRSERRLCEEVSLNLDYRWFCRLGLEDEVPDHSTFSKNRHGRSRESGLFRHVFESVLQRCMSTGLVAGEGFAVDASVIEADASRCTGVAGDEVDWSDLRRQTGNVGRTTSQSARDRREVFETWRIDTLASVGFANADDAFDPTGAAPPMPLWRGHRMHISL